MQPSLWCAKCGNPMVVEPYEHDGSVYKVWPCLPCAASMAKTVFDTGVQHGLVSVLGQREDEKTSAENRAGNCKMEAGSDIDHHDWTDNMGAGPG